MLNPVATGLNQSSTIRGEQDLQPHLDVRTLSAPPKDGGGRGGELKRELKWSAIYVIALVLKHYQPITSFLRGKKRLQVYNWLFKDCTSLILRRYHRKKIDGLGFGNPAEIKFDTRNLFSDILLLSLVTYNIVNTFNRYSFHLSAHSLFIVCQMGSFLKSKSISWGVSFVHKDWKCSASQQWRARVWVHSKFWFRVGHSKQCQTLSTNPKYFYIN